MTHLGGKSTLVEMAPSVLMKKVIGFVKEPYQFPPYHEAIREPFDYYKLGTDFASPLVDKENSVVVRPGSLASATNMRHAAARWGGGVGSGTGASGAAPRPAAHGRSPCLAQAGLDQVDLISDDEAGG